MKWFTGMRMAVAAALVMLLVAPVALCAVNTQPTHSCCEGMVDHQPPVKTPVCCSVQAPTQPSVTTAAVVDHAALPTIGAVGSAPSIATFDRSPILPVAEFSPPPLRTILRI